MVNRRTDEALPVRSATTCCSRSAHRRIRRGPNVQRPRSTSLFGQHWRTSKEARFWGIEGLDSLRSDQLEPKGRRFFAAVLLRMLASDQLAFRLDTPLGRAADPALDAVLSGEVYRKLGVDTGTQSFTKHKALSQIAPDAERNLASAIAALRPATLRSQRTAIMKAIADAHLIIEGFVPRSLSRSGRISTLFDIVRDHLTAPPDRAVTTLETAREELAALRNELLKSGRSTRSSSLEASLKR